MNKLPAHLLRYQTRVNSMKMSQYMDVPAHVHLETYALCNARCGFCPYAELERKGTRMPDALIEKIIRDLRDIPSGIPLQISPFKVNEPFLDTRIFDVLALINNQLPAAAITLTTNASALTVQHIARLSSVKNLGYLWISVNESRREPYERVMNLPYDRTQSRLTALHEAKHAGRVGFRVVLSRVGDGTAEDAAFCAWVAATYPLFEPSVFPRGGWLGQAQLSIGAAPDVGCTRWFDMSITATGTVAHCCMDGQARWPIGDVNREHVLQVYNAPHYRRLRESTLSRHHHEPCNSCTFL